ncbi:MAG: lactate dehydrogenase [Planctomycetes bacterium]|nr:lactate dehydrogenase [Planctomycetota bacterium]
MDVAIVGASGACGRMIATHLLADRVLEPHERLQLVGRAGGPSARALPGLCTDLRDAFAGTCPELDVALTPEDVVADLVVIAAGRTVPPLDSAHPAQSRSHLPNRDELAADNIAIFEAQAEALARLGAGHEIVLVLSNPVELGVAIFSRHLGRHRVIGVGGHSDTLRFRREIASELGVRRQLVSGFVVGEHGMGMVPAWSTVKVHGLDEGELSDAIAVMRRGTVLADFHERLQQAAAEMLRHVGSDDPAEAFAFVDALPPDVRTYLKPWATQLAGGLTANVTATVTVDLIKTVMTGNEVVVAGQVMLDGDLCGLRGPLGVPVVISPQGWTQVVPLELDREEVELLSCSSRRINEKIGEWLGRD